MAAGAGKTVLMALLPLVALCSPLHDAVQANDIAGTFEMLASGSHDGLDEADGDHYTPLHLAAGFGYHHIAEMLLDEGARVDIGDENGETPLHLAAHVGHTDVVQLLLDRGAPVDAASNAGYRPLHLAAEQGQVAAAELLLTRGADVAATTYEGTTPLHWAAHHDRAEMATVLIRNGAPLDQKDSEGQTPVDIAMRQAKSDPSGGEVLEVLKSMARKDKEMKRGRHEEGASGSESTRDEL